MAEASNTRSVVPGGG